MGLDDFKTGNSKKSSSSSSKNSNNKSKPPKKDNSEDQKNIQQIDIEDVDKSEWDIIISHPKDPRYEVDGIEHLGNVLITFSTEKHPSGKQWNAGLDEEEYINIEENKSDYTKDEMVGENTVNIHKADFEQALNKTGLEFNEVDYPWADECIYEATSSGGMFVIRVYSTIDQQSKRSRGTGEDSIKVNVVHNDSNQPMFTATRTYREPGWDERLLSKIEDLLDKKSDIEKCSKCGSIMVIRENSDSGNEFYGCTNYPDCKNTKPLD